jgi:homoserine O-acetyltransferase
VEVHRALLAELGIDHLLAAIGGSLGGMQVLQWAIDHPGELDGAIVVAASARLSPQNIAFSAVAREAIMRDPDFAKGDFYETGKRPDSGLGLARMIGHITYLSEASMREKFGRRIQDAETPRYGFDVDFQVESYLHYQGQSFVERFDANTYLYLGRVMDYFDPFGDPVEVQRQLADGNTSFLVLSFDSDWRFSTEHSRVITDELRLAGAPVTFREIESTQGHDSFLFAIPDYHATVTTFMDRLATEAGIGVQS